MVGLVGVLFCLHGGSWLRLIKAYGSVHLIVDVRAIQ